MINYTDKVMGIKVLTWFILSYGLMNIMVFGSIFKGLRNTLKAWGESRLPLNSFGEFIYGIVSCPMCFSTWGGFFLGIFVYSPIHQLFDVSCLISWFFDGILSSGAVWAINAIIEWFEVNRPENKD
jgi:hypothetical protein